MVTRPPPDSGCIMPSLTTCGLPAAPLRTTEVSQQLSGRLATLASREPRLAS
jgi:hypothetical protein